MSSDGLAEKIIEIYRKFGWEPRLILGSNPSPAGSDHGLQIREADIDAIWFSRPKQRGEIAWELRHLSETPYSILEHLDEDSPDFESRLKNVEARMAAALGRRKPA